MSQSEIPPVSGGGQRTSRYRINLGNLPLWLQYSIAVAVAGIGMYLAWHVGHTRPTPAWFRNALPVWMFVGPLLLLFFLARWALKRGKRR